MSCDFADMQGARLQMKVAYMRVFLGCESQREGKGGNRQADDCQIRRGVNRFRPADSRHLTSDISRRALPQSNICL